MTIGFIGASPDQLDALALALENTADQFDQMRNVLGLDLYNSTWIGGDADTARSDWDIFHSPALASAAEALIQVGTRVRADAAAQRAASGADFYQSGGGGGTWPPPNYPGDGDPQALRDYWLNIAATSAGIDLSTWDPALGANANSDTIVAVYTYYGNLYLQHPYMQWAGMANMVGPAFAAGFFDIHLFGDIAQVIDTMGLGGSIPAVDPLLNMSEGSLEFYETTFLTMQQEIFYDQAVMHEAYLAGGMDAIQDLHDAGIIDQPTLDAWAQIDEGVRTGNPALIEAGNTQLLLREQRDIIDGYYQQMYNYPVTGQAFTYMLGVIGQSGIPGTVSFAQWNPAEVWVGLGPLGVNVSTPLPEGNLALFNDRWDYLSGDTLPAYQELLRTDPELAAEIIATPVEDRIADSRLSNSIGDVLDGLTGGIGLGR